ncbi:MAG TPA: hypothetical protein VK497_01305 [Candidatus Saccharimonadales bacterium]|nr:hypothetical protein [Candidatus Saccharimonadales bacterium]
MTFNRSEYANYSSPHNLPPSGALRELALPGYYSSEPPALEEVPPTIPLPDIELGSEDTQLLALAKKQAPYRAYVLVQDMLDTDLDYQSAHTHANYAQGQENPFLPHAAEHQAKPLRGLVAEKLTYAANALASATNAQIGRSALLIRFPFDKITTPKKGKHVLAPKHRRDTSKIDTRTVSRSSH